MARTAKEPQNTDQQKENSRSGHSTHKSNSSSKHKSNSTSTKKKRAACPSQDIEPLQPTAENANTDVQMQGTDNNSGDVDEVAALKSKFHFSFQRDDDTDIGPIVKLAKAEEAKAAAEALLAAGTSNGIAQVKMLPKPRGEAGDGKRGYNLRHAMALRGKKGKKLYTEILVC